MATQTLIITLTLPTEGGRIRKPLVTLAWPAGPTERFQLHEHDWGADSWDWRNGHLPTSLTGRLRAQHFVEGTPILGTRVVYISPAEVGVPSNEQGRVMVYELEYEV